MSTAFVTLFINFINNLISHSFPSNEGKLFNGAICGHGTIMMKYSE